MPPGKPRVLVVTRNLPPLRGGMERLNHHLLRELAAAFEVRVCCPHECLAALPQGLVGSGVPLRPLPGFVAASAVKALTLAVRFRPDLVLAGSGLTAPMARLAAAAVGARSVAYLHGLDIAADHWAYRRLWVRQFPALSAVLVNSRHTAGLATRAGVPAERVSIVHPGVELPPWEPALGAEFRQRFGLGDRPLLLSLGRLTARKGLVEFVEQVMPGLAGVLPEVVLAVIGGEAVHALKGGGGGQLERLQASIRRLGLERQVRLLGEQDDRTARGAFFASRALVFPVLDLPGDVEGFGMVAIEAAAHGVPTLGFAVGGVPDAVAEPRSGSLFRPGDYAALAAALQRLCAAADEDEAARLRRRDFAAEFEWSRFGQRMRAVCGAVLAGPGGLGAAA
ncbi:MAG: glycosyltransferase family 4 protein [Nevskia sp.]|nr:glycosyltransferase family 4 protein [Nevskia sp.]